jgi:hypothetical protein
MVLEVFPFSGSNVQYKMYIFSFLFLPSPGKENAQKNMKHPVVVISYPTGWKLPINKVTKKPKNQMP